MSADATIREILERYDERPGEGVTWKVQSATVITHKALERIAVKAQIRFPAPTVIRAERDEAVILVTGTMKAPDGAEPETAWSIGECLVNVNYRVSGKQAAYPYAMAEKRAKDRVILKLIGLHGLLYSEEEADEFKDRPSAPAPRQPDLRNVHDLHTNGKPIVRNASQETAGKMLTKLWTIQGDAVGNWLKLDAVKRALDELDEDDRHRVEDLAEERIALGNMEAAQ